MDCWVVLGKDIELDKPNKSYKIFKTLTFVSDLFIKPLSCCTTLLPNFYPVKMQHSSCKHVFSIRVENSLDPDQMAFV